MARSEPAILVCWWLVGNSFLTKFKTRLDSTQNLPGTERGTFPNTINFSLIGVGTFWINFPLIKAGNFWSNFSLIRAEHFWSIFSLIRAGHFWSNFSLIRAGHFWSNFSLIKAGNFWREKLLKLIPSTLWFLFSHLKSFEEWEIYLQSIREIKINQ